MTVPAEFEAQNAESEGDEIIAAEEDLDTENADADGDAAESDEF